MEIRTRALNKDEYFICSKKDVKQIFGDSLIEVYFAHNERNYESRWKEKKYIGKVIARMYITKISTHVSYIKTTKSEYTSTFLPSLYFYVLKKDEYSEKLRKEFVTDFLPRIKEAYLAHKDDDPEFICGTYTLEIELLDGKLIWHDFIEPPY